MGPAVERGSRLVVESAQEAQGRDFVERIDKCGAVTGDDVQVAVAGFDKRGKETGAVDPFTFRKDGLGIGEAVDGKVEGFYAPVFGGIHEVHHPDALFADKAEHIRTGKITGVFLQEGDEC